MKKLVCLVLVIMLALVQSIALAQNSSTENAVPINPENYPYFYVMGISQPQAEASSSILLKGCFGDFQLSDSDGDPDVNVIGFDEKNSIELKLADDCEIRTPMDFDENIATNLPCQDILQWYATQNEGKEEPFTFYAVLTLDELNQVTKLEYQYFPWG